MVENISEQEDGKTFDRLKLKERAVKWMYQIAKRRPYKGGRLFYSEELARIHLRDEF